MFYNEVMEKEQLNLLNIRQACRILNVHPDTLRRWEKEKKIKSIRIGPRKDRRYRIEEIYSLIGLASPEQETEPKTSEHIRVEKKQITQIHHVIEKAECVLFDLSDTLMIPFPSRGDILSDIAYRKGLNINPLVLEKNFFKLYDEWEKEKLLSDFTTHSAESVRENLYAKLNADVLTLSSSSHINGETALEIGKEVYHTTTADPTVWRVLPGVMETLNTLKLQKKKLALVDNWNHYLHDFVKQSELADFFPVIISGGELGIRKPDKKIFELALEKLHAQKEKTVYIGNRYIDDVLGPQASGITPILFDQKRQYTDRNDFLRFYSFKDLI